MFAKCDHLQGNVKKKCYCDYLKKTAINIGLNYMFKTKPENIHTCKKKIILFLRFISKFKITVVL